MEKQLKCSLMLTLEEMCLRRVAVILWSEPDVLTLICKYEELPYLLNFFGETWDNTVVEVVEEKMQKLQVPESIKTQISNDAIIDSIGSHILNWKLYHLSFIRESGTGLDARILEKLCFTTAGSVDYRKTAELLVHSDLLDIVTRYKLACLYCLEDYISNLWNELPDEKKKDFYDEKVTISRVDTFLWFLWPYILNGEEGKLDRVLRVTENQSNFRQFVFEYSAMRGNKAATEYFFQKLLLEERQPSLVRAIKNLIENVDVDRYIYFDDEEEAMDNYPTIFPKEKASDVLCYLLSMMTFEQQMKIIKDKPYKLLKFFLQWPWDDIFLDNVEVISTLFTENDFGEFFWSIDRIINRSYSRDFCIKMTSKFRKYFLNQNSDAMHFFIKFLNIQDSENLKFIIKNVDAAVRLELLTSFHFLTFYYNFNHEGRCHIVKSCIREATLSKEDLEKVKKAFIEYNRFYTTIEEEVKTQNLEEFFEFVSETDRKGQSKRRSDNETLNEAKKLCCEKD